MAKRNPRVELIHYLESSALVAALVERDLGVRAALRSSSRLVASALTFAETARALVRARVGDRVTADQQRAAVRALRRLRRRCFVIEVDAAVLGRVGRPFPIEPVRTLDAIHLASAERLDESPQLVVVISRDERVRANAEALGHPVLPAG